MPIAVGASCFFLLIGTLTPAQAATKVTTIQLWGRDSTASFLKPLAEAFNKSQKSPPHANRQAMDPNHFPNSD